jgi:hypothetical protein
VEAEGQSEYYGISVTRDGGKSWNVFLPDEKTHDVAFNYIGTAPNLSTADFFAATENGLYRSNNAGNTWLLSPTIMDKTTNFILTTNKFLAVESQKLNTNEFNVWCGTNTDGLIKFFDNTGTWNGDWTIFLKSGNKLNSGDTFAFPNPFSPGSEVIKIKYNVNSSSNVTIRVFDFGMNLVRTVVQNVSRPVNDQQIDTWDGKDENGKIVPNGVYFYRVDIGSDEPMFGKIMVLM